MTGDENVVPFVDPSGDDDPRHLVAERGPSVRTRTCWHRSGALINKSDRSVTCRACGAPLDPLDVLWQLAVKEEEVYTADQRGAELEETVKVFTTAGGRLSITKKQIEMRIHGKTTRRSRKSPSVRRDIVNELRSTFWSLYRKREAEEGR